ncbi:MAG: hypothetical protein ACJ70Q_07665 [Nitrososphaera sp.]
MSDRLEQNEVLQKSAARSDSLVNRLGQIEEKRGNLTVTTTTTVAAGHVLKSLKRLISTAKSQACPPYVSYLIRNSTERQGSSTLSLR